MAEKDHPPQSKEAIGVRVRETRLAIGLDARAFYEKCGFSKTQLNGYEVGQNLMKPDMAARIILAFPNEKLDFNWFYRGDLGGVAHDFAERINRARRSDQAA